MIENKHNTLKKADLLFAANLSFVVQRFYVRKKKCADRILKIKSFLLRSRCFKRDLLTFYKGNVLDKKRLLFDKS